MLACAALLLSLPALTAVHGAAAAPEWRESPTEHFRIMHQAEKLPSWFPEALEKMHALLRRDLELFASWILQERLTIYVYKARRAYLLAPFKPPKWSRGMAQFESRAVSTFLQEDRYQTMSIIAHECGHLAFHGYWSSYGADPPVWLDEGFAELLRGTATSQSDPRWSQGFTPAFSVRSFVKSSPKDLPAAKAASWYSQAYSLVAFLYRKHSAVRFKKFCAALREGTPLEKALEDSYGYASLPDFEKAWTAWAVRKRGSGLGNNVRSSEIKPQGVRTKL